MDISGWLPVLWFLLCFVGCLNLSYVIFDYYKSKPILMSTILDKINCDIIVLYTFGQSSQILALSLKETVPAVNTWVALFLSWGLQFTFQSVPLYLSLGVLLRYCQVVRCHNIFSYSQKELQTSE